MKVRRHPLLASPIANEDCDWWAVGVRSHDDDQRISAARAILHESDPDCVSWQDHEKEAVAHFAQLLKPVMLREHIAPNDFDAKDGEGLWDCACQDEGWFCINGDGDPWPFFSATREQIDEASFVGSTP